MAVTLGLTVVDLIQSALRYALIRADAVDDLPLLVRPIFTYWLYSLPYLAILAAMYGEVVVGSS